MTLKKRFATFAATVTLAAVGAIAAGTSHAAEFYKGKTLTLIVPVPAGSGLDRIARDFARYWEKHIPGNPEIVPKNMPGGGGAQALNFLSEKARPDGETVAWGPWNAAGLIAGSPGLRYDPAKFELIGAGGAYVISMMRTDVPPGVKAPADVLKPERIIVGGRRADRSLDIVGNLALEMIGAKYRFVGGYRGMAKLNPAIRRNEIHLVNSGHIGYFVFFKDTLIKDGEVLPLWYHPPFDIKGNPVAVDVFQGVKSFVEVYEKVHGKKPSGPSWETYKWYQSVPNSMSMAVFAPPGTPKEAVDILRKSHKATAEDPEYTAEATKRMGTPLRFISLEQGLNALKTFRNVTPEMRQVMATMAKVGERN